MVFNSLQFVIFFVVVLIAYRSLSLRYQNYMLLIASYVFYGVWDYRFLLLLIASTLVDYYLASWIAASEDPRKRKALIWGSVAVNLGVLGFFKYFDFFADSFVQLAALFDLTVSPVVLHIVLPVGISFYVFQSMSYTIDVYRKDMQPARTLSDFALYVAFFPQLVAGPIERATTLLPQITAKRVVTPGKVGSGLYLILLGLFKKVVVADNLAKTVDRIFSASFVTGPEVLVGTVFFAFQIYCDFSGYTDIARGAARIMGFELMINFRQPFFARNPSDLMRRWHISLSSWLRDYLFVSLGGSRGGTYRTLRNLCITMVLCGLWHGAAWNFVLWGIYFSSIMVAYRLYDLFVKPPIDSVLGRFPWIATPRIVAATVLFFALNLVGFLIFRSTSLAQVGDMLTALGDFSSLSSVSTVAAQLALLVAPILLIDWIEFRRNEEECVTQLPIVGQAFGYSVALILFLTMGEYDGASFIYFQF